ncbi:Calx-beta domain-containing protein [Amycolatopsis sp. YIM 10]|uniref:Calx-beta domain-containing protein n=1 Tax=Amycolatopsis sp. YIM 10 TaxID=2653857 RepID=UPI00128FE4D4|nr:Calx-beta domain-containing protein [Amycolatopsis sp. YIM 10]QFU92074.1 Calx-beta domain protein [Amycolatopsis sp. YIM 10]
MNRRHTLLALTTAAALLTPGAAALAAPPGVDPSTVELNLLPGQSTTIAKNVTTAPIPPNPDLVLLADTTGSMTDAIGNVQANAGAVTDSVRQAQPTAQFGVASYQDEEDSTYLFRVEQNITADTAAVQAGLAQWQVGNGGDTPESAINALHELATGAMNYRPDDTKIVAWFGDAPSHDPSNGHTLADTIAALQAAKIRVVAVNVGNGQPGRPGLDAADSGVPAGQATQIVNATGGVLLNAADNQVAQKILEGIQAVKSTVSPVATCDPQLTVTNAPSSVTVDSGSTATFTETIAVAAGTTPGTYRCTVDYLVDGVSRGFIENTTVHVRGLAVDDVTVSEGAGSANFTVSLLGGASPDPVTVNYATANGSATAPADYAASGGTVTIPAGQTSAPVTVPIVSDAVDEATEDFTLNLSSSSTGVGIVDGQGVGTIIDDDRDGSFSCTGTAADVAGITVAVANPANLPCVDDSKTVASISLNAGLLNVKSNTLTASTDLTPDDQSLPPAAGDRALSTAKVDKTTVSALGLNIELGVIEAQASASCVAGPGGLQPAFAGSSNIASLKINGVAVTVGSAPLTIPLLIGSLKLNSTVVENGVVTQEAVAVDTPLAHVVLAKAQADVHGSAAHPGGSPCTR